MGIRLMEFSFNGNDHIGDCLRLSLRKHTDVIAPWGYIANLIYGYGLLSVLTIWIFYFTVNWEAQMSALYADNSWSAPLTPSWPEPRAIARC